MKNIKAEDTSKFIANAITSGVKGGKASKVMSKIKNFKGEKVVALPRTPVQKFMNTISFGFFD